MTRFWNAYCDPRLPRGTRSPPYPSRSTHVASPLNPKHLSAAGRPRLGSVDAAPPVETAAEGTTAAASMAAAATTEVAVAGTAADLTAADGAAAVHASADEPEAKDLKEGGVASGQMAVEALQGSDGTAEGELMNVSKAADEETPKDVTEGVQAAAGKDEAKAKAGTEHATEDAKAKDAAEAIATAKRVLEETLLARWEEYRCYRVWRQLQESPTLPHVPTLIAPMHPTALPNRCSLSNDGFYRA